MNNEQVAYEAPQVESVLTAEELEREVYYAGTPGGPGPVVSTA